MSSGAKNVPSSNNLIEARTWRVCVDVLGRPPARFIAVWQWIPLGPDLHSFYEQ